MQCSVEGIQADDVAALWPAVEPLLGPAIELSNGRFSRETVRAGIEARDLQLWLAYDEEPIAAMVTEVCEYQTGMKTLRVMLVGGSRREAWLYAWPHIEDFAKSLGCRLAETGGRRGWERVLKDWRQTTVEFEKDLTDA